MRHIRTIAVAALAASLPAAPAAAQDPDWVQELQDQLSRQAETIARAVEAQRQVLAKRLPELQQQIQDAAARREAARERQKALRERQAAERSKRLQMREQAAKNWPEVTEPFSRTLRLGRNGTFDLQNLAGSVVVTGGGGNEVRVDAVKRVRDPKEEAARGLLRDLQIEMLERGGNVEVRTDYPRRSRSTAIAVDYTVSVPRDANVTIRTVSGDVRVTSVNGELQAETVSGDLTTSGVRRVRSARSVSGAIEIVDAAGDEVSAGTIGGDVVIRNLKARSIDLQSVSGDLRFTGVESDRANIRSISGDINYAGPLARSGRYEFQTHSGDIRLTPAGGTGFSVDASTFNGDVRSDFALTLQGAASTGRRFNQTVRGSFGSGDAMFTLRSFSGDIVITK